ncbi:MAG TPA: DUF503 domain-containing protein [Nitrospira sp.]|jgi:uncharacterized protein YlxP (DUF503 family)|nr:DUF503 domain-containing protein [Nitrospira sp.]MCC7214975.1 DUF503 domain-containing protein [Nitrospira sp.]TKB86580.1 MAG: DUF503 domain-containing protein [Nitrospira sp.]HAN92448.1 DUF503 domain-containing protein [Nitrospira sp.]HNP80024.1 DUF503 domain-containing protein [Nitrospira sp.]
MTVGLCTVELFIPDGHSLKEKRQVLQSLKTRLRDKFNLSVAEVGDQDLWQKAILGMACVANESAHVNQVLDQAVNLIQSVPVIQLVRSRIELL